MTLKIEFLSRASFDLIWFKFYYEEYFPEGREKATIQLKKSLGVLANFPNMGRIVGKPPRRCLSISNTAFTVVYRQKGKKLEILRVLDQRSETYLQDLMDHDDPH